MQQFPWKFDLFYAVFFALVISAYFEVFGDGGVLFYLIHTPYLIILFPSAVLVLYFLFQRKFLVFTMLVVLTSGLYLEFFATRSYRSTSDTVTLGERFRVCSWNTAYFFQWGRADGFTRLAKSQCDAILLQEVWRAEELDQELNALVAQYLPGMKVLEKDEYVFILREPVDILGEIMIPEVGGHARLTIQRNNTSLTLVNVHIWNPVASLPYVAENGQVLMKPQQLARIQQREALLRVSSQLSADTKTVIAGDFNTMQNGKILRDLQKVSSSRFAVVSVPIAKSRNTYPISHPILELDHVFVDKAISDKAKLSISCEYSASDHCLLIVDLML
jgi:endonuclease/exonuclease/phosphatase family metal-dependent hydrolase